MRVTRQTKPNETGPRGPATVGLRAEGSHCRRNPNPNTSTRPADLIKKDAHDANMNGKLTLSDVDTGVLSHQHVLIKDTLHCDGHFVVLGSVRQAVTSRRQVGRSILGLSAVELHAYNRLWCCLQVVLAHLRWPQSHYLTALRRLVGPSPTLDSSAVPGGSPQPDSVQGCSADSLKQLVVFFDLRTAFQPSLVVRLVGRAFTMQRQAHRVSHGTYFSRACVGHRGQSAQAVHAACIAACRYHWAGFRACHIRR